jgi:hypothetical protein
MLHQEPTEEEQEQQRILDAMDSPGWAKLIATKDVNQQPAADDQGDGPTGPGGEQTLAIITVYSSVSSSSNGRV